MRDNNSSTMIKRWPKYYDDLKLERLKYSSMGSVHRINKSLAGFLDYFNLEFPAREIRWWTVRWCVIISIRFTWSRPFLFFSLQRIVLLLFVLMWSVVMLSPVYVYKTIKTFKWGKKLWNKKINFWAQIWPNCFCEILRHGIIEKSTRCLDWDYIKCHMKTIDQHDNMFVNKRYITDHTHTHTYPIQYFCFTTLNCDIWNQAHL